MPLPSPYKLSVDSCWIRFRPVPKPPAGLDLAKFHKLTPSGRAVIQYKGFTIAITSRLSIFFFLKNKNCLVRLRVSATPYLKLLCKQIYRSLGYKFRAISIKWCSLHGSFKHFLTDAQVTQFAHFLDSLVGEGFWKEEAQAGNENILQYKFLNGYGYCLLKSRTFQIATTTPIELHNFVILAIEYLQRWKRNLAH